MTYIFMHKRKPVAEIGIDDATGVISGIVDIFEQDHLPVGVFQKSPANTRSALNEWWLGRAIPESRSGLRDALEALRISSPNLLLTKCLGLSLSDQYWVRPKNMGPNAPDLQWDDINFFENEFSADVGNILFGNNMERGNKVSSESLDLSSPDNTLDGWLKKKWVVAEGKRMLLKGGSDPANQEPINEALASSIMDRLKIPHVPYTLMWDKKRPDDISYPLSACEDFITTDTELVSAWRIFSTQKKPNHFSNYQHTVRTFEALGIPRVKESLDMMIVVDFLIANTDRHFNNFGAVRNAETLEWLGPAPIFDSGTSMWHDQITDLIHSAGKNKSRPFRSDHADQIKLVNSFDWLDISALSGIDEEYGELLRQSVFIDDARRDRLCFALRTRVRLLEQATPPKAASS